MSGPLEVALDHHRNGRLDQAEAIYRALLVIEPNHADALHLLGVLVLQRGDAAQAVALIERAVTNAPRTAQYQVSLIDALNRLANLLHLAGDIDGAVAAFREVVRWRPDQAFGHVNLGQLLLEQGWPEEAETHCRTALRLAPSQAAGHNNLGNTLRALGRFAEAEASYAEALRLLPRSGMVHSNVGQLREEQGRGEAVEWYRRAVELEPGVAQFRVNLASALATRQQFAEAEGHYRAALCSDATSDSAHAGLADILSATGRLDEARSAYLLAHQHSPSPRYRILADTLLPPIYDSLDELEECRHRLRENLDRLLADGVRIDPSTHEMPTLFYLAYQGRNDRELAAALARLGVVSRPPPMPTTCRDGKARIGFLCDHPAGATIGRLNKGVITNLDRSAFEVVLLTGPGTGAELARCADRVVVLPRRIERAVPLIAAEGLDLLLYTDIGMNGFGYSLACHRLASVQCVTWGHPVTNGLPTIDYFLSSVDLDTDDADDHYTERLVRLPRLAVCYERPVLEEPPRREDLGLPMDGTLYACPQSLFKFHPDFDALLAGVLRGDPRGRLVILEGAHPAWKERLLKHWARTMPDVLDRFIWVGRMDRRDFLRLWAVVNVVLDPIHFGGGNTSYEALGLGTPIVTLPSNFLRGRITHALYRQMGWMELSASDADDYVRKALRLGTEPDYYEAARRELRDRAPLLFDDREAVRYLEGFFRQALI